jgi:hypothetical protein
MLSRRNLGRLLCGLVPFLLFWIILSGAIPVQFSQNLALYSAVAFILVAVLFYSCFRLPAEWGVLAGLSLAMILFAVTISYKWTTGYSDGGMIAGLTPYKDAKDYYMGAGRILDGLPLDREARAVRRPLFPGFIASLELLDGQNLKLTVGLLSALAALSLYLSARQIRITSGPLGAGLYSALMYFYIQPLIGYTMSELSGFIIGCLALSILWMNATRRSWLGFGLGLITLMLAVSSRSGAFIVFPFIVVWAGWVFRQGDRFSWRAATITAGAVAVSYLVMNNLYGALLRVPPGANFQAFAYAMYGQVHGGTGWHSAIDDLHTTQTDVVAAATLRFFLAHPFSFVIAAAKSYMQLLLPGAQTIFAFGSSPEPVWLTYALWAATMALIIWGLVRSIQKYRQELPGLVLAGLVGTLVSVPFLPPIDAGARFYVSTMGFLFVLPAIALGGFGEAASEAEQAKLARGGEASLTSYEALALLALILVLPLFIDWFSREPIPTAPSCPANQRAFAFKAAPAAYVDVLDEAGGRCGFVPEICLSNFDQYGTEKSSDDFYQAVLSMAQSSPSGLRLNIAINLLDSKSYYFVDLAAPAGLAPQRNQVISGCALEQNTRNQTILQIVSSTASNGN